MNTFSLAFAASLGLIVIFALTQLYSIVSKWWRDRKEERRIALMVCDDMAEQRRIARHVFQASEKANSAIE